MGQHIVSPSGSGCLPHKTSRSAALNFSFSRLFTSPPNPLAHRPSSSHALLFQILVEKSNPLLPAKALEQNSYLSRSHKPNLSLEFFSDLPLTAPVSLLENKQLFKNSINQTPLAARVRSRLSTPSRNFNSSKPLF